MSNKFFFRDEYTQNEKIDRIPASSFSTRSDVVSEFIDENIESEFQIDELTQEETINRIRIETSNEEFDEFIDDLFEEEGKRGDPFNIRLFEIPNKIDEDTLEDNCRNLEDIEFTEDIDGTLTTLQLNNINPHLGSEMNFVDLEFKTPIREEEYSPSQETPVEIINSSGEQVAYSANPEHTVRVMSNETIEARIYIDLNSVVISNSGVDKKHQEAITLIVDRLGQQTIEASSSEDQGGENNE
ncbi:hypothetical protein [Halorhabdus sp. CUG00001]|uniref:hypothetical protein n=1 Tax=Halorhabdus sp. CUG00001 TaxID=2600297 RepID=UPI00131C1D3E|nr:hypothetical protein [Halorhabdus sp. CUG00001]